MHRHIFLAGGERSVSKMIANYFFDRIEFLAGGTVLCFAGPVHHFSLHEAEIVWENPTCVDARLFHISPLWPLPGLFPIEQMAQILFDCGFGVACEFASQ
jgi:hypothetical protein